MIIRLTILGALLLQGVGFCTLQNPGFEEADSGPSWFLQPAKWDIENYGALHNSFTPVLRDGHEAPNEVQWSIPAPSEGSYFLVLSTGDTDELGSDPIDIKQGKAISSEFLLVPGNTLSLSYIFGTCDWYSDYATIRLIPTDPNNYPNSTESIELLSCKVENRTETVEEPNIRKFGSSGNWKQISYMVEPDQKGVYILECQVEDGGGDNVYKSYLAIDNITYCTSTTDLGDINLDCTVDMVDFSLFASVWLDVCHEDPNSPYYEPNSICDPNVPIHDSDFNDDWIVDTEDLTVISNNWLKNFKVD